MRLLWKVLKVGLVLAIGLPLAIIAVGMSLGLLGALVGLAVLVLRVAIVCAIVWLAVRFAMSLLSGGSARPNRVESLQPSLKPPPPVDPHYEAALRELDREFPAAPAVAEPRGRPGS
jgi:hypothetical protein